MASIEDIEDFDKLWAYKDDIRSNVRSMFERVDDFQEVFDEAYFKAFAYFEKNYDPNRNANEKSYLTTVTYHRCIDVLRKSNNRNFTVKNPSEDADNSSDEKHSIQDDIRVNSINKSYSKNLNTRAVDIRRKAWSNPNTIFEITEDNLRLSYLKTDLLKHKIGSEFYIKSDSDFKLKCWINYKDRKWMTTAVNLAKKSLECLKVADNLVKGKKEYPVLAAIAIDTNDNLVECAYKGEFGNFEHHCEYVLFTHEDKSLKNNLNKIKDGSLFVTLEPCNKRGVGKIPCAVRIALSSVSTVFIGIVDANESVTNKGVKIIETGIYTFNKNRLNDDDGLKCLKGYFDNNLNSRNDKVKVLLENGDLEEHSRFEMFFENDGFIKYAIGNCKKVKPFHRDIQNYLLKLNRHFIEAKGKELRVFLPL